MSRNLESSNSFSFSLLIEGQLTPEEKERLLELLTSKENYGVRELDLEMMFEAKKILLPRISETAAILVVRALRNAAVQIRLGPSDLIFSDEEATEDELNTESEKAVLKSQVLQDSNESLPMAEKLPVSAGYTLFTQNEELELLDAISASLAIRTALVEAERSYEYQSAVEALKRELKYRAFQKGADGIVNFTIQLTALHDPTRYKLTVLGSAVKIRKKVENPV